MKLHSTALALIALMAYKPLTLAAEEAVPVVAVTAASTEFADEIEALGTLRANESVNLTLTVTELVTEVNFEDGQQVKAGDVLVVMNAAEEQAELAEEQSRLAEAQRQIDRLQPLTAQNAASKAALDTQQREVETARARIQAIESRIAQRRVRAPFDGVVGLRNISIGALAQPGTVITTLDDVRVMKLDFSVPARHLQALHPGLPIAADTRAFPERTFSGEVTSIDSRVDPVTRSIAVRALLDNSDGALKPGLLMRVQLRINPRQALVIPEEALLTEADRHHVYVVLEDAGGALTVAKRAVRLGARRRGEAEIIDGLNAGDRLVTEGVQRLRPGAQVRLVSAPERG